MTDFLQLAGKNILVMGAANKKSVAWHCGKVLAEAGARVIHVVRSEKRRGEVAKLLEASDGRRQAAVNDVLVCDVEKQAEIDALAADLKVREIKLDGVVHSIAFANYSKGFKPFHETAREDFLQAVNISCFSLLAVSNALKPLLNPGAGVVTIGISDTRMAAENYGYMAPIKAALHASVVFQAKSFAADRVRFNAVGPSLLKTSASAGIPDYMDSYLYAEMATLRHEALKTEEVGNVVAFLVSPRSSGINAQHVVIDAGMSSNYFDRAIVKKATKAE